MLKDTMHLPDFYTMTVEQLVIVSIALATIACFFSPFRNRRRALLRSAPSEESHWLWGHEYHIWKNEANDPYFEWTALLGPVFKIKAALFQPDIMIVSDPVAASYIFQNAYRYEKAPAFRHIAQKFIGKGIVWAEGDEHRLQRRLISPAFTSSAVRGMHDDVFQCAEQLVTRMKKEVADRSVVMNVAKAVSSCTLDIIGRTCLAFDFNGGQSPEAEVIFDSWHKDVNLGRTFTGFLFPIIIGCFSWITKLPLNVLQDDGVSKGIAIDIARKMLQERRSSGSIRDDSGYRDALSVLARSQLIQNGDQCEDWRLLENMSTLIMAGHETTCSSLAFTLLELARNQEVQSKLREELESLPDFNPESILRLEYLDAVTKEGLRIHPSSPRADRIASANDELPISKPVITESGRMSTSIPVKAGQIIQIPLAVINASPVLWGADAMSFKPERHLTPEALSFDEQRPRGPYGHLATFIEGPRACIGWRLAILEFKVILALLFREFIFEVTDRKIERYVSGPLQSFCEGRGAYLPLHVRAAKT